jgi:hypothetical protein
MSKFCDAFAADGFDNFEAIYPILKGIITEDMNESDDENERTARPRILVLLATAFRGLGSCWPKTKTTHGT